MPKFSIIIPAHNSAKFIKKALITVKMQTFTDYELIVVCDACTDNTAEIARKYTNNVIEVDFTNEGLTRNVGLNAAVGDWILWIDDDDWWMHEYVLEELDKALSDEDVLCFGFIWKHKGYMPPGDWIAVWNKCWRRSFIGDERFGEEFPPDKDWHFRMMAKPKKMRNLDKLMYYYDYLRKGSQTCEKVI